MRVVQPALRSPGPIFRGGHLSSPIELRTPPITSLQYGDVQSGSAIDYWRILFRRKALLGVLAAAGLLGGVFASVSLSPVYQARTSLEIQNINPEFLKVKEVSPLGDFSPVSELTDIQTQIKILQSETLIKRTLNQLGISSFATLNPQERWRAKLLGALKLPKGDSRGRNPLIETAAQNLKASVSGQTRIIEITYESTDARLAANFANTLASEFIEQNKHTRWQVGQLTSALLSQQLEDLRGKLRKSDDALQSYARRNGLIYTEGKENISQEKLRQLQAEGSKAQADRVSKESRFEVARAAAPETLSDVQNDSNLRALQATLNDLRRQEAEISTTFKPDYSKAKKIHAEIAALESSIAHERSAIVGRISNEFEEARQREKLLSDAYDSQVQLVMQDSDKSISYNILRREVDTNLQVYAAMLQRVKESNIAAAMTSSNVRVIDAARLPVEPYKPNLPINAGAGMMCGVMLGIVIVVTQARRDGSVREPGEIGRLLGILELGVIPRGVGVGRAGRSFVPPLFSRQGVNKIVSKQVVTWHQMSGDVGDALRTVLASIIFSGDNQRQSVLVITSASPNEGKTTTATNLAVALAKIDRNVLLIDGDIRKPCVHAIFGLKNIDGLVDVLNQTQFDSTRADTAIQATDVPNLRVLTAGQLPKAGRDVMFSATMFPLINHYREQFDMIIIDAPPLLRMPDARILGRLSDSVVLVARAGHTHRDAILAAFTRLVQDDTAVLGVILNDWNPKSSADGYYGNYTDSGLRSYGVPA